MRTVSGRLNRSEYGSLTGLNPSDDEPWTPAPEWRKRRARPEQLTPTREFPVAHNTKTGKENPQTGEETAHTRHSRNKELAIDRSKLAECGDIQLTGGAGAPANGTRVTSIVTANHTLLNIYQTGYNMDRKNPRSNITYPTESETTATQNNKQLFCTDTSTTQQNGGNSCF
jgi:hypothetical protein